MKNKITHFFLQILFKINFHTIFPPFFRYTLNGKTADFYMDFHSDALHRKDAGAMGGVV